MDCAKCKKPLPAVYKHVPGVGDCHYKCPEDTQMGLVEGDECLPIDHIPESYPD